MSWTKGARRDFPPNLKIIDEMVAFVDFLSEPREVNFGKKKTRSGKEIDDVRYLADVKYLKGTARAKRGSEDSFLAKAGETYTLWLPTTLSGKILEVMGWKEGQPAPTLTGTKWKIWRSQERRGGNRIYDAQLLTGGLPEEGVSATSEPVIGVDLEAPAKVGDATMDAKALQLADALKTLKKVDLATWKKYCNARGVDPDAITKRMEELGLVETDSTSIKYRE